VYSQSSKHTMMIVSRFAVLCNRCHRSPTYRCPVNTSLSSRRNYTCIRHRHALSWLYGVFASRIDCSLNASLTVYHVLCVICNMLITHVWARTCCTDIRLSRYQDPLLNGGLHKTDVNIKTQHRCHSRYDLHRNMTEATYSRKCCTKHRNIFWEVY
jgi:hypothetical protein